MALTVSGTLQGEARTWVYYWIVKKFFFNDMVLSLTVDRRVQLALVANHTRCCVTKESPMAGRIRPSQQLHAYV